MDYRAEFREGIKGGFSKYKNMSFDPENLVLFNSAVSQGYDDAKRTFTNIGKFWKEHDKFKEEFFKTIAQKIQEVFKEFPAKGFNNWHKEACNLFVKLLKENGYKESTCGQAQKVINMAFKYLYCLDGAETYNEVFDSCHMPLDSFILEWFYRQCKYEKPEKEITKGKMSPWSALAVYGDKDQDIYQTPDKKEFYTYFFYQKQIRNWFAKSPTPLQAEFEIWSKMQIHLTAEEFLFSIKSMSEEEKNNWRKEKDLKLKLETVRNLIDDYLK